MITYEIDFTNIVVWVKYMFLIIYVLYVFYAVSSGLCGGSHRHLSPERRHYGRREHTRVVQNNTIRGNYNQQIHRIVKKNHVHFFIKCTKKKHFK